MTTCVYIIPQMECDSYNSSVSADYKEILIVFGDYNISRFKNHDTYRN